MRWIALIRDLALFEERNLKCHKNGAYDLAKMCGLNVPESKLTSFSKYGSTFLVKALIETVSAESTLHLQ